LTCNISCQHEQAGHSISMTDTLPQLQWCKTLYLSPKKLPFSLIHLRTTSLMMAHKWLPKRKRFNYQSYQNFDFFYCQSLAQLWQDSALATFDLQKLPSFPSFDRFNNNYFQLLVDCYLWILTEAWIEYIMWIAKICKITNHALLCE
jgi:hypothetical protein